MKKRIIALGFAFAMLAGLGVSASAGVRTPRANNREQNQRQRIGEGVRSGELTRAEASRLAAQQAAIRVNEARYRSDGYVSPSERARLNRQLNRTNRNIYRQKHDRQDY